MVGVCDSVAVVADDWVKIGKSEGDMLGCEVACAEGFKLSMLLVSANGLCKVVGSFVGLSERANDGEADGLALG